MNTALLLITSLLAVLISLLSEQVPRCLRRRAVASARPMTGSAATPSPSRRPWDPPFPHSAPTKSKWLLLPPSTLERLGSEHNEGTRGDGHDDTREEGRVEAKSPTPRAVGYTTEEQEKKAENPIMPVFWIVLAILAGSLLVLAFAMLVAQCLAWFIVYKTEARLGEARKGLVQGGEMRLCLCARG
jgi:hypothetical protein